jgi:hypothetical protein
MNHRCPSNRKTLGRALAGALAIGLLAAVARNNFAASGGPLTLPSSATVGQKPPKPSGLSLTIDTSWMASNGYRPVRIKITPLKPVTADRTLMIRLSPIESSNYYYLRSADVVVTQQFDVRAQTGGVSGVIAVPQHAPWNQLKIDVFEDGEPVEDLSQGTAYLNPEGNSVNGNYTINGASNAVNMGRSPTLMQIGGAADEPCITQLLENGLSPWSYLCVDADGLKGTSFVAYSNLANTATQSQIRSLAELPERWIDYSGVDVFLISLPKLQELIGKQPKQWVAIRRAVMAGANLWVFDVGERFSHLRESDKAIDLEADLNLTADDLVSNASARWIAADVALRPANLSSQGTTSPATVNGGNVKVVPSDRRTFPYLMRSLGRGQIVAMAASQPGGNGLDWTWLLNGVGAKRLSWSARHGMALNLEELNGNKSDFWEFLIPGVGLTPVLQFQILISLFVILIGPVNYLLLKRWRRLGLLLITVPASAILVTLVLFGYAFIHDGLGVRVRARSFTQLDLRRGEAVCWTRLSFYAGLSPSRGLTFPGDVAVYPYAQEPPPYRRGEGRAKELRWQESEPPSKDGLPEQHFSSDWLPSRTPTQFITVRARKTRARLSITQSAPGTAPAIENRLGTQILGIAVSDAAGNHFAATNRIAPDARETLAPMAAADALKPIQKTLADNDLQVPVAAQATLVQQSSGYYSPPYYSRMTVTQVGSASSQFFTGPPSQRESVLERSLHDWSQSLGPRSYVAIVEKSPEVILGIDSAHEEAGLHVVAGEW